MRPLPVALLAVLLLAAPAQAQPAPGEAAGEAQELANQTVEHGGEVVGGLTGDLGGKADGLGGGGSGLGDGLGDAAGAVGAFLGQVAQAVGGAAVATWDGLGAAGDAVSAGLASGLLALADGASSLASATGAALRASLLAVGAALGAAFAALGSLYGSLVAGLRPKAMDERAFAAVVAAGAAGTSAAAGYGLWALARTFGWLLGAPMAGFSRIHASDLLEHPLRAQVFQVIQSNPGIHASELSRKVGAGWGTITHHLDKLEKARLVATRRVNNQKCYFEDGGKVSSQDMAIAGAVRGDSASQIASFVAAHPMTSQKAMAAALGMSPALASFHVKKLAGLGVLEKVRRGKETLLTTTQAVRRVMTQPSTLPVPVEAMA